MERADEHEFRFAAARSGDSDAMLQLARSAYIGNVERIGREPAPMSSDYKAIAASGDALLAWRDGRLMGMLVTSIDQSALHVTNVAVSPQAQGRGLGSRLLAEAEQLARDNERDEVRLYTNAAMVENVVFYSRRGYQESNRGTEDGYQRVYFVKRVGGEG